MDKQDLNIETARLAYEFYKAEQIRWIELKQVKQQEFNELQIKITTVMKEIARSHFYTMNLQGQIIVIENMYPEFKEDKSKLN